MKLRQLIFTLSLSVISFSTQAFPVIYDTDMAIDDWFALLYLAKSEKADLKAVTVSCSGETHCRPGMKNSISLLNLVRSQKKIPVAAGDPYPLDGYFVFPEPWQKDSDTLSGVPVVSNIYRPSRFHAIEIIHNTIEASDEPVTIIAVGPLTNIAQWLQTYPEDSNKVAKLIIMGGSLDAKGNIIVPGFTDGHPNTKAEWNIFVDPLAADIVFKSDLNIELVGLDVTNHVKVTHDYVAEFNKLAGTPESLFAKQVYKKNEWFIDSGEYYFWDVLAAIISTHPELCGPERTPLGVKVDVVNTPVYQGTSDLSMPDKRWDGKVRNHLKAETAGVIYRTTEGPEIDVCMQTNREKALSIFTETLTRK